MPESPAAAEARDLLETLVNPESTARAAAIARLTTDVVTLWHGHGPRDGTPRDAVIYRFMPLGRIGTALLAFGDELTVRGLFELVRALSRDKGVFNLSGDLETVLDGILEAVRRTSANEPTDPLRELAAETVCELGPVAWVYAATRSTRLTREIRPKWIPDLVRAHDRVALLRSTSDTDTYGRVLRQLAASDDKEDLNCLAYAFAHLERAQDFYGRPPILPARAVTKALVRAWTKTAGGLRETFERALVGRGMKRLGPWWI